MASVTMDIRQTTKIVGYVDLVLELLRLLVMLANLGFFIWAVNQEHEEADTEAVGLAVANFGIALLGQILVFYACTVLIKSTSKKLSASEALKYAKVWCIAQMLSIGLIMLQVSRYMAEKNLNWIASLAGVGIRVVFLFIVGIFMHELDIAATNPTADTSNLNANMEVPA